MKIINKKADNIFITTNYSMFKNFEENREISLKIVNLIIAVMSMLIKTIGKESAFIGAILVAKVMEKGKWVYYIVDGKHRFEAAKNVQIPIKYELREMTKEAAIQLMIDLNTTSHVWTTNNYAVHHSKSSNKVVRETYTNLLNLKDDYGLTYSNLCHIITGSKDLSTFKNGTLRITSMKDVETKIKFLNDYRKKFEMNKSFILRNLVDVINQKEYKTKHTSIRGAVQRAINANQVNLEKEASFKKFIYGTFNKIGRPKKELTLKKIAA